MILSKNNLKNLSIPGTVVPQEHMFDLPEKVLQFGTGVLLRGLPDYFIDKANRMGIFNGRIVVVKSTDTGSATDFDQQDGLYTLTIKGIDKGQTVEEHIINSSISRVLSAGSNWGEILAFARNPNLKVVLSNTTEVGIQLVETDRMEDHPPVSFPGKLLAVLHERYKALGGGEDSGLVIVPTELIVNNGNKLKHIVLELAGINNLEPKFISWLEHHNHFCNSLVDRIVPGKPDALTLAHLEDSSGYTDSLRTVSEVYSLWAIEGGEKVKEVLSFAKADAGVVIEPDIEIYRELKLRLLNGTHTLSCGVAYLSGFRTVKNAMDDSAFSNFMTQMMLKEIAPSIPYHVTSETAHDFAYRVLDRFKNPHIEHLWHSISAQYAAKMKMRVVPLLLQHYKASSDVPRHMALGFAAFILFLHTEKNDKGEYVGNLNGTPYVVTDSSAAIIGEAWKHNKVEDVAESILSNENLWDGPNLTILPGFTDAVVKYVKDIKARGMMEVLRSEV
jgi:tagaturonate reductase